jgi:hypothetical protein
VDLSGDLPRKLPYDKDLQAWKIVFWVFPRRLSIKGRRFGTLCRIPPSTGDLHHLLKLEPTQCSETSAFNTQTPGKYPEDNLSLQQHGESLKTRPTGLLSRGKTTVADWRVCVVNWLSSGSGGIGTIKNSSLENVFLNYKLRHLRIINHSWQRIP